MTQDQILSELKIELQRKQECMSADEKRIRELKTAINALEGNLPHEDSPKQADGPAVTEMIEHTAMALHQATSERPGHSPLAFDHQALVKKASHISQKGLTALSGPC